MNKSEYRETEAKGKQSGLGERVESINQFVSFYPEG